MKVLETFSVKYVTPETPEEQAEIASIIESARKERFGVDFAVEDLETVEPGDTRPGTFIKEEP